MQATWARNLTEDHMRGVRRAAGLAAVLTMAACAVDCAGGPANRVSPGHQ